MISAVPTPASPMIMSRARRLKRPESLHVKGSPRLRRQPVADTAYGDQPIASDLAPQVADIDLDGVRAYVGGAVPDVVQQLSLADPPARRYGSGIPTAQTRGGQVRRHSVDPDLTARRIQLQISALMTTGRARAPRRSSALIRASNTTKEKGLVR